MRQTLVQSPRSLGRALRDARRAQGLTQQVVAERAGLRQPTVSNLERGQGGMGLAVLLPVLAVLRLELIVQQRAKTSAPTPWTDEA